MTTEGEGSQSGSEGTQGGAGENTNGAGNNDGTGSNSGSTGTQSGTESAANGPSEIEKQRDSYQERMRAADQRAAKFEAELKQLKDKDLPAQEKLAKDFAEAQAQLETYKERNREMALANAFLKDNTYTWHNPERALKLADLSKVEVSDDGAVTGLKDALVALAKSDAYLLKTEKESEKEGEKPPGTAPGNNGASGVGKPASSKSMSARFPGLNTRVRS